jgi:sialic acid synthase SpsE
MSVRRIISDYVVAHPEEISREYNLLQEIKQSNNDDCKFSEYILNTLKNPKSLMKILPIIDGNSNNCTCYSIFSGESEAVESGFGFMGIES